MNIKDWTLAYIEYLNSFKGTLEEKSVLGDKILCKYSDKGRVVYYTNENLVLENDADTENNVIVCLNKKENLSFLIDHWKEFASDKKLKIIFVNIKENLQWAIIPYIHDKFNDSDGLETGLKSLFNSVPSV